jgi:hypothetical protein
MNRIIQKQIRLEPRIKDFQKEKVQGITGALLLLYRRKNCTRLEAV